MGTATFLYGAILCLLSAWVISSFFPALWNIGVGVATLGIMFFVLFILSRIV